MHRVEHPEADRRWQRKITVQYSDDRGSRETRLSLVNLATFILTNVQRADSKRRLAQTQPKKGDFPNV